MKKNIIQVDKPITDKFIRDMSTGVKILDTTTLPCRVEKFRRKYSKLF